MYKTKEELKKRIVRTEKEMIAMKDAFFRENGKWYYEGYWSMARKPLLKKR